MAFLVLVTRCGALRCAKRAVERARAALATVRNKELGDADKERAVRAHALALLGLFAAITALSALALGLPLALVWLAGRAGVVNFDDVLDALASWQLLVGALVAWIAWRMLRRAKAGVA